MARLLLEMSIYKKLGLTREDLARRPWREVLEIFDVCGILDQEEAAQMRKAEAQSKAPRGR